MNVAGHYTQLVWAETNRVGCGFTAYSVNNRRINYYVCNYGPAGNFAGKEVYKTGPGCSQCPTQSVCSTQFPNLCGKFIVFAFLSFFQHSLLFSFLPFFLFIRIFFLVGTQIAPLFYVTTSLSTSGLKCLANDRYWKKNITLESITIKQSIYTNVYPCIL